MTAFIRLYKKLISFLEDREDSAEDDDSEDDVVKYTGSAIKPAETRLLFAVFMSVFFLAGLF